MVHALLARTTILPLSRNCETYQPKRGIWQSIHVQIDDVDENERGIKTTRRNVRRKYAAMLPDSS